MIGKIFFLIAAFFTVYVLINVNKAHAQSIAAISEKQSALGNLLIGYNEVASGELGKIHAAIIEPEPVVTVDPLTDFVNQVKEESRQRDMDGLLASQADGRYGSYWRAATGTSDKTLQLERVMLGAGGGIDSIRAYGYPIPVYKVGTFADVLPFCETELGMKICEGKKA
tara:strand:+ start:107 stop:613 length:507 start_codon:yes stop_codon:yes gene_type:complete